MNWKGKFRILSAVWLYFVPIAVWSLALAALDFARRMETSISAGGNLPENAVVFTGQFGRVHAGLALLRERRVEQLFVSGVNRGAGIHIERFAEQFGVDAGLRQALRSGRLALGPVAQNTWQNAAETACWYERRDLSGPILLITSRLHMPRASLALERALPGRKVLRMSLPRTSGELPFETLGTEFLKFAATAVVGLVPSAAQVDCPAVGAGEAGQP